MIQYPVNFEASVEASCGMSRTWSILSSENQATCAIPPEFEGPGGGFSPEDLFAQALTNCFVATFQVMAERSSVTFERLEVRGRLVVDRDEAKRPCMQRFHFQIRLISPSDRERAERLVKKSLESGFILNSVKTAISHELVIG